MLVENNIWPISGKCQYYDLMRFRIDTWLNETCTKLCVSYLQSLTEKYFFLDAATFNDNITQVSSLMKLIEEEGYDNDKELSKDIIILFHIDDHFIIVEVCRSRTESVLDTKPAATTESDDSKQNDDTPDAQVDSKTPIALACSLGQSLESLTKQVQERHLDLFLNTLLGSDAYEYELAEHVQKQNATTMSDCGVICLQRMYKYATLENVSMELPDNIKSPLIFRCFALYKILEHFRDDVSPFVIYNEKSLNAIMSNESIMENKTQIENVNLDSVSINLLEVINEEVKNSTEISEPSTVAEVATLVQVSDSGNQEIANPSSEQSAETIDSTNVSQIVNHPVQVDEKSVTEMSSTKLPEDDKTVSELLSTKPINASMALSSPIDRDNSLMTESEKKHFINCNNICNSNYNRQYAFIG